MVWHSPDANAWQRARERQVPLLLLIEAAWCPHSRRFREEVLESGEIMQRLQASFVCVRVDQDLHPEPTQKYGGAGWPTLAVVHSDGTLLAQSGPQAMAGTNALLDFWTRGDFQVESSKETEVLPSPVGSTPSGHALSQQVMDRLLQSADPKYGGWGQRQKFPHPQALHFALVRWSREGDQETLDLVQRTLQHMQTGAIHDRVEGGFFRYARTPDWSHPQFQKMVGSNAQRMLSYAEAYQALGTESYRATALGIEQWLMGTAHDPSTGAFRASQDEDPEYYHLPTLEARAGRKKPETDPLLYTDRNCEVVCAFLKAGVAFQAESMTEQALTTLDFLVEHMYRPGRGVQHYWDGKPNLTGLLKDQASLLRAMAWAMHYSGTRKYLTPAVELAHWTLKTHRSAANDGSLVDQLHDVQPRGSIGERQESLPANASFAEALLRLGHHTQDASMRASAREILEAFQGDWPRFGNSIAEYGRAVDLLAHEPVQVTIIGKRGGDRTRALRRAALTPYIASRVVQTLDLTEDVAFIRSMGWPVPERDSIAVAYLHQSGQSYARTTEPEQVPALMIRLGKAL